MKVLKILVQMLVIMSGRIEKQTYTLEKNDLFANAGV